MTETDKLDAAILKELWKNSEIVLYSAIQLGLYDEDDNSIRYGLIYQYIIFLIAHIVVLNILRKKITRKYRKLSKLMDREESSEEEDEEIY